MFDNEGPDSCQFMAPETFRHRQSDRIQPVFCDLVAMLNVNMRRLGPFSAKKENRKPRTVSRVGMSKVYQLWL